MKKLTYILAVAVLLLTAVFVWQKYALSPQDSWIAINKQDIVKILITRDDAQIVLSREHDQWYLPGHILAAQDAVSHLLDDLVTMQVVRVVTKNHQHDETLGLLQGHVLVQCLDAQGSMLLNITIGKQGSDLLSTYVRRDGDDAVVAVNKVLVWQVKRSAKTWQATEKKSE